MSPFGIRKKLKSALKKAILGESDAPTPAPTPAPRTTPTRSAAPVKPSPPPAAAPSSPPPAQKRAQPKAPEVTSSPDAGSSASVADLGTSWVQAAGVKPDEMIPGTAHSVEIFGKRYALYKTDDGEFFVTADGCPHAAGPLSDGELDGHEVTCPFHAWTFDIRDGSCTSGQGMDVACTAVKVRDDMVFLEVPL